MNAPELLPPWASKLRDYYASGSTNTFLLHGNVADRFIFTRDGKSQLGALDEFIAATLLERFSIIFTYPRFSANTGQRIQNNKVRFKLLTFSLSL